MHVLRPSARITFRLAQALIGSCNHTTLQGAMSAVAEPAAKKAKTTEYTHSREVWPDALSLASSLIRSASAQMHRSHWK